MNVKIDHVYFYNGRGLGLDQHSLNKDIFRKVKNKQRINFYYLAQYVLIDISFTEICCVAIF